MGSSHLEALLLFVSSLLLKSNQEKVAKPVGFGPGLTEAEVNELSPRYIPVRLGLEAMSDGLRSRPAWCF